MTNARPVLTSTAAQLYVADVRAAADYYTGKLGFAVDFLYGDPPFYGQVKRDAALLALRCVESLVFVGDIRAREQLLAGAITLATRAETEALYRDYVAAGVRFEQPLEQKPWGAVNFVVCDPDGNLVLFAGPAT